MMLTSRNLEHHNRSIENQQLKRGLYWECGGMHMQQTHRDKDPREVQGALGELKSPFSSQHWAL